jgi:hypothetical protein
MFWKASSTLLASRADVSIKDRWFSPAGKMVRQQSAHGIFLLILRSVGQGREGNDRTGKGLGLVSRHRPQMPQIALVSDQHNDNVGIGMVPELLEPPGHVLVGLVLADVVDEQGADGSTVVSRGDGAVALLASCIPDLGLDGLGVDLDGAGRELDSDGGLGVDVELVAGESAQKVGLSDAGVSDQDDYRGIIC